MTNRQIQKISFLTGWWSDSKETLTWQKKGKTQLPFWFTVGNPTDKNNIITSLDIFFSKSHGLKGLLRIHSSEIVTTKLKMTSSMADVMFVLKEGTKWNEWVMIISTCVGIIDVMWGLMTAVQPCVSNTLILNQAADMAAEICCRWQTTTPLQCKAFIQSYCSYIWQNKLAGRTNLMKKNI